MNDLLEMLTTSVSELSNLYKTPSAEISQNTPRKSTLPSSYTKSSLPRQTGCPSMFLSQVPVQQYYNAEENFTTQLTAYTRKQFFQVFI